VDVKEKTENDHPIGHTSIKIRGKIGGTRREEETSWHSVSRMKTGKKEWGEVNGGGGS